MPCKAAFVMGRAERGHIITIKKSLAGIALSRSKTDVNPACAIWNQHERTFLNDERVRVAELNISPNSAWGFRNPAERDSQKKT